MSNEQPETAEINEAGRAIEAQAKTIEEAIGLLSAVVNRWHYAVDLTNDWQDIAEFAHVADAAAELVKKLNQGGERL